MKPWETLGRTTTPDGSWLELRRHDGQYVIAADGYDLMVSRVHRSEEELAALACAQLPAGACVLVGGLGMGYTLRAVLDRLPGDGTVVVAELIPAVVSWNRGPLGELTARPLDDARVSVAESDVGRMIRANANAFNAILLDVDNGPDSPTQRGNNWLYSPAGLAAAAAALRPRGALAVWSVADDRNFARRLQAAGFIAETHRIRAHGTRAVVFIGRCAK